ncbi:hypothetical protein [Soonwooa sp.]|uniref:hypothetical protein n=1 Tax=Soonwooa sp. TaxID=1938592 RepID=UPI0028A60B9C|nr:hypothetical protein [Soonwooa sp.]
MKLNWTIEKEDIEKVNQLIDNNKDKVFYKNRLEKNVNKKGIISEKDKIWKSIVVCLLTSQQNSSAESPISRFSGSKNFPLDLEICKLQSKNLEKFVAKELKDFGGIRFYDRIANLLTKNFEYLEKSDWKIFDGISKILTQNNDPKSQIQMERDCAKKIQDNLKGFGPKQSRNLLQILGLTVYEIPIDSRIAKWLNTKLDFPLTVSATTLQDLNFYNFVSDAIQNLCEKANVKPCLFDASVFIEGDKGEWTLENSIF